MQPPGNAPFRHVTLTSTEHRYVAALVLLPELTSLAEVDVFFGGFFTQPGASTFFFPDRSRSPQFDVVD